MISQGQSTGSEDVSNLPRVAVSTNNGAEVLGQLNPGGDLEVGLTIEKTAEETVVQDPNLVTWDGPTDPKNPKNWSFRCKWAALLIVSTYSLISPISSSMVAPALPIMSVELHITNNVETQLFMTIFLLAYAIGPLLLGPLSEVYGRVRVLQLANLIYLGFNTACGFATNRTELIIFRFLSGFGGCASLSISGGLVSDLFGKKERGKAIAIYSLAPLLGPTIGPLMGGFVTQDIGWHWVFYTTSIADGIVQILGLLFLQETFAPVLLRRLKAQRIKETGNQQLYTQFDDPSETSLWKKLKANCVRPFRLLLTQPIIQVLAFYAAFMYGIVILVLSTFSAVWTEKYHESTAHSGLNYIAIACGTFMGAQSGAIMLDRIYARLSKRNNGVGIPEYRMPLMAIGAIIFPAGLFWYGWSAENHVQWIVPDLGVTFLSCGVLYCYIGVQSYTVDTYSRYAASALAATSFLRSFAGFAFPLFAPDMYKNLGYGWGNSLLAFIAIFIGLPTPFLLWRYGPWLRARSPYATGE